MADTTIQDPLGRQITLHDRIWDIHILKRHPEMDGRRDFVERAISDPSEIRVSAYDPVCRTYYGLGRRLGIMTAVVVDLPAGRVKTAFFTGRMKGAIEWSRQTP